MSDLPDITGKATILGKPSSLDIIDIRKGKAVDTQADAELHRQAGGLLVDWWVHGGEHPKGLTNYWCVSQIAGGLRTEFDLRQPFLATCWKLSIRLLPGILQVLPDGRSRVLHTDTSGGFDFAQVGAAFHEWNDDPRQARVTFEMLTRQGSLKRWKPDVRPLLNQVLRRYDHQIRKPRMKRQNGGEVRTIETP